MLVGPDEVNHGATVCGEHFHAWIIVPQDEEHSETITCPHEHKTEEQASKCACQMVDLAFEIAAHKESGKTDWVRPGQPDNLPPVST
ncbi:MAG: hypothetical protein ACRDIA_07235 [Actinomycetota bacterium]